MRTTYYAENIDYPIWNTTAFAKAADIGGARDLVIAELRRINHTWCLKGSILLFELTGSAIPLLFSKYKWGTKEELQLKQFKEVALLAPTLEERRYGPIPL